MGWTAGSQQSNGVSEREREMKGKDVREKL